ncbi:MAG: hypothetical protein WCI74_20110, partial [Actinomycetes bacterium]
MASPNAHAVTPTAVSAQTAASAVATRAAATTVILKGVVGVGTKPQKARSLSVKSAKASTKSRVVTAGNVQVATTFSNRCGPVTLTLSQAGQQVAKATGRSGFKAGGKVSSGVLKMSVGSAACRTAYKLRVVNQPAAQPVATPTIPVTTATGTMTAGDLPGWKAIFAEDFNTAAPLGSFLTSYKNFGAYPY